MRFHYDKEYFPVAPSIDVVLWKPDGSLKSGPFKALVDTGSDGTLIPIRFLRSLNLPVDDHTFLRSQWGERRLVDIYTLDIGIGLLKVIAVEVVGDTKSNELILGRNVLNKLILTLNGPKQILEVRS